MAHRSIRIAGASTRSTVSCALATTPYAPPTTTSGLLVLCKRPGGSRGTASPEAASGLHRPTVYSSRASLFKVMASSISDVETGDVLGAESIWPQTCAVYDQAQKSGAATTAPTTVEVYQERCRDVDVAWVLRLATFLKNKPTQEAKEDKPTSALIEKKTKPFFNPFDPPDPALTVGHLSATHTLVLNKFNVVPHHSIVVTRSFQPQTDPLNAADLAAVYSVMRAMPDGSLSFFNCGEHSGRSQPHKHVQIVPLPFAEGYPSTPPLASAFLKDAPAASSSREPFEARSLPFRAYCCKLSPHCSSAQLEDAFKALFSAAFSAGSDSAGEGAVSYNWLGCQDFMALFPRSKEKTQGLAVNALGFAGTILCRSEEEVATAKQYGCLNILADVGQPW
mmetsp:Transcript_34350/g.97310  ORF Transcript_34350/g.97310 Transcript_34350/m.97310 type:complete len:393 (-) Transcript_34350:208-1386(-)